MSQSPCIPPLRSGGIMLSYRCSNRCAHCLYCCGPDADDEWMNDELAERVFASLAREPELCGVHLAGGEAMLKPERVLRILQIAQRHRVRIDYLETNVFWCVDEARARDGFQSLYDAGLRAVLISASLFHNEWIPFERTRLAVNVAREIFAGQVIVWTQEVYDLLSRLDPARTYSLAESCEALGIRNDPSALWRLHGYLVPNGRTVARMSEGVERRPWTSFAGEPCARDLASTSHFHIDPYGNLFTGLCPGIAPGTVEDLHPEIDLSTPAVFRLWTEGVVSLAQWAAGAAGFVPREGGYISRCELCIDARRAVRAAGLDSALRPDAFYKGA